MNSYYFTNAEYYDFEQGQASQTELGFYRHLLNPPLFFLEVGSGTGRIYNALIEMGYQGVGIDLSFPMLKKSATKCTDKRNLISVMDCKHLGIRNNSFDIIFLSNNFFLEFDFLSKIEVLNETKRILTKNGLILIDVINPYGKYGFKFLNNYKRRLCEFEVDGFFIKIDADTHVNQSLRLISTKFIMEKQKNGEDCEVCVSFINQYYEKHQDYLALFHSSKFDVIAMYGNYNFNPITQNCDRLIYLIRPRRLMS